MRSAKWKRRARAIAEAMADDEVFVHFVRFIDGREMELFEEYVEDPAGSELGKWFEQNMSRASTQKCNDRSPGSASGR